MTGILWAVLQSPLAVSALYCCGKPHHITLKYGVKRKLVEELIDLPLTVGVKGMAWNNRIQAVEVVLPTWVSCQTPHPHISVSWVKDAHPVEANTMLAADHNFKELEFDHLFTMIEFEEWEAPQLKPDRCSECGGDKITKNGKTRWGRQRWICKSCGKQM